MLPLPEAGVRLSRTVHNSDLQLFCDWIEGCLLFGNETRVSRTAIVDVLCEENIYDDQGFANAWLDEVWSELQRRKRLLDPGSPYDVTPRAIERKCVWKDVPAYSFCVLAPLMQRSKSWQTTQLPGNHYSSQGALFERISEESFRIAGWNTLSTGWSARTASRLPSVVTAVAAKTGEPERPNWAANVQVNANEAGLDVIFFRSFTDGRCGFPVFLTQCASGADWDTKLHTPVLAVWEELVHFATPPQKAFTLPHSLAADELRRVTISVQGTVFDRYRLHCGRPLKWCSPALRSDLHRFLAPIIRQLPTYS